MAFKTFQVFPNGNNMLFSLLVRAYIIIVENFGRRKILATLIIQKIPKMPLLINESLNNFDNQTFQTSKQKWWGMLTCYYKPLLTMFWQALVEENKCHIYYLIKNANNARN